MSTDIELPSDRAPKTVVGELKRFQPVFAKLLADTGISEEAFTANIAQAVRSTPKLNECDPSSVLAAGLRCAQLGLTPNDSRNLAWIIPRGREATWQLGYVGVMELARRACPGLRFDGRPVYPNDEFLLDFGKSEPLTHVPYMSRGETTRGGDPIAWYVKAVFPDGTTQVQVLDREGVEYHRNFSKMKGSGMWSTSYDAAALKSCVIDLKRWLPASPQLAQMGHAIATEGNVTRLEDLEREQAENVGDITPEHAAIESGES